MNRTRKIWLAVLYAANVPVATLVWLIFYGRGSVLHFAGVYFTPAMFALADMVFVDVLIFLLLSG